MTDPVLTPEVDYDPTDPAGATRAREALERRRAEVERGQQLRAAIDTARQVLALREAEGARKLEPLAAVMERLRAALDEAQARWETQRRANQSACAPLQGEIGRLIGLLNAPSVGFGHRVPRQWALPQGEKEGSDTEQTTLISNSIVSPNQG
jgi:hypothetical protein